MTIDGHIEEFYEHIRRASESLANFSQEVGNRQQKIMTLVGNLINSFDSNECIVGNEIEKLCAETVEANKESMKKWIARVESYIEGKEFVNKFEKNIILTVFANVNTGKSTLGNFMAGLNFEDTDYEEYFYKPEFYVYDWSKKEDRNSKSSIDSFAVDSVEATSTIQYFTLLNGLTWVDTPGIQSLTAKNEELAKRYVNYSDLVLFLTPSNDPGKINEIREMEDLMKIEKPLLLAITRSDERTREIVDNERKIILQPKSRERRKTQEDFLAKRLAEKGILKTVQDKQYISLSVDVANQALKDNDEELFIASGIPELYKQIGKVISKQSFELKRRRPKNEINAVIRQIKEGVEGTFNGIDQISKEIDSFLNNIAKQKKELDRLYLALTLKINGIINSEINDELMRMRNSGESIDDARISELVGKIATEIVHKELLSKISKIINDFRQKKPINIEFQVNARLEDQTQSLEYEVFDVKEITRDPRGLEWIVYIFTSKKFTKQKVSKRTEIKTFKVGDNINEVLRETNEQVAAELEIKVKSLIEQIKTDYFCKVEQTVHNVNYGLEKLSKELTKLKYD